MDKTAAITQLIEELSQQEFTGTLTLNFFRGGIGNINKAETIRFNELAGVIE